MSKKIWTKNRIQLVANECTTRDEFNKKFASAYAAARGLGILDKVCIHMKPPVSKKLTQKEIIKRLIESHPEGNFFGNPYNYSKFKYKDSMTPSTIICPDHGEFLQSLGGHVNSGNHCFKCGRLFSANTNRKSEDRLIEELTLSCKDRNITFDPKEIIDAYQNSKSKLPMYCTVHEKIFDISFNNIQKGKGCLKCGLKIRSINRRKSFDQFVEKANNVHNNFYTYPNQKFVDRSTKAHIICPEHGNFFQISRNHLQGQGCPKCKESKGEREIDKVLTSLGIEFERQKRFKGCKNKHSLLFDFYTEEYNLCIEYDGEQHFKTVKVFAGKFGLARRVVHDVIKNKCCEDNDIYLLRIPYTKFDNIETIIKEKIDSIKKKELFNEKQ